MSSSSAFWYVYGVVPAATDLGRAPEGLDDTPLALSVDGELAAVASELDGERYAPAEIERGTEDVEWLAPRAVAHDRVLTWLSDRAPVVPLPIFSLFSGEQAVRRMLRERREELTSALRVAGQGREYALRIYRIDSELAAVAAELSPRLAELQESAASASPGQRYLLERKLDTERKNELHGLGAKVAREVLHALSAFAIQTAETKVAPRAARAGAAAEGTLVLDAAFLVAPARLAEFQRALTDIVSRHTSRGFRFDFTGPWPPYHFVQHADKGGDER
jgi:Gas vesicle synthesis protein GvpL/GvpF